MDTSAARLKIENYCAYQERCHKEVRDKLYQYGLAGTDVEQIISDLIQSNLLNEERYSKAYAGGKFRTKKWGRRRIIMELKRRDISEYCINKALVAIPELDYQNALETLIVKYLPRIKARNQYEINAKVASYCIGKGYESELVWEKIRKKLPLT